jgi:glycosyltransferase involved in cell wall biosynthesis
MISIIIPTKNRPQDLYKAIKSIINQKIKPDELIVVDQSIDSSSKNLIEDLFKVNQNIILNYVLDSKIDGLVKAKDFGVNISKGDLILFLEDDVVLEVDYLAEIIKGFDTNPLMVGCCGNITNHPKYSVIKKFIFHFFHLSLFKDNRIDFFGTQYSQNESFISTDKICGGISAWKRDVFNNISFDTKNNFHMLEDIDFSTRVASFYGNRLFINLNAKLEHNFSEFNREYYGPRQYRKIREYVMYYKKRKSINNSLIFFIWLMIGMFFEATYESIRIRSLTPILGYFNGLYKGCFEKLIS